MTGLSRDRNAKGVNRVPCCSPSLPTVGTHSTVISRTGSSFRGDKAGKGAGNKNRISQIPTPRALTEAVRGVGEEAVEIFKLFQKCQQLVILREDYSGLWLLSAALAGRIVDY